MSKKIQLTIPTPCHEDWEAMTPVEKGKFCGSCQKQVVDFSNMSDRQIAEFFKKPSTGSVCGRFMGDQLDREIEIPRKRIPWVKYLFQVLLPAFFVSKASAEKTQGKISVKAARDTVQKPVVNDPVILGEISTRNITPVCAKPFKGDTIVATVPGKVPSMIVGATISIVPDRVIRGNVVSESGDPIPFASIETGNGGQGVMADKNGFFQIWTSMLDANEVLSVTSVGFESKDVKIDLTYKSGKMLTIQLSAISMPEVILNSYVYPVQGKVVLGSVYSVKKSIFKPIPVIQEAKNETASKYFKVFPNPIPTGSNLTIEWRQSEEGYFTLQLLNSSGQSVHQQQLWIDADARLLNIDLPFVASGNYFLAITSKKTGKRFTEKLIIQ